MTLNVQSFVFRALERHGCKQTWSNEASGSSADGVAAISGVKESKPNVATNETETVNQTDPTQPFNPCPFTSTISDDAKQKLALKEFDEKVRKANASIDKALITRSAYHQSLLRVSWNLIESEILHSPGKNCRMDITCQFIGVLKLSF